MLSAMDGTWASIKTVAGTIWRTRAGLVGAIVFVGSAIFGLANLVGLMGDLSATWELFKDWLPVVGFFVATAAFFRAADEAKRHSDAKEQATKAIIDGLHKRYDERTSSLQEKIKENHRRELEELARWSEMATQLAEIARRHRFIASVRESREHLRRALEAYVRMLEEGAQETARRGRPHEHDNLQSRIKHLADNARYIDSAGKYPIGATPLDSDINAARPPYEDRIPQHEVTRWRTLWLMAERALEYADRLAAEVDGDTMRKEVNLMNNVAARTAT